jgi:hypothetical protein
MPPRHPRSLSILLPPQTRVGLSRPRYGVSRLSNSPACVRVLGRNKRAVGIRIKSFSARAFGLPHPGSVRASGYAGAWPMVASFGSAARRSQPRPHGPRRRNNAANATIHPMSFKRLAYCTVTSLQSATVMRRPWFPAAETHAIRANRPIQAVRPASPISAERHLSAALRATPAVAHAVPASGHS